MCTFESTFENRFALQLQGGIRSVAGDTAGAPLALMFFGQCDLNNDGRDS